MKAVSVKDCWDYWSLCKDYWIRSGSTETEAIAKAYWWDCIEVWDFDKSWTDAKRAFTDEFIRTFPKCQCPKAG